MKFKEHLFQIKTIAQYDPGSMTKHGRVIKQDKLLAHFSYKDNKNATIILKNFTAEMYTHVVVDDVSYEIVGFQPGDFFLYELKQINGD